MTDKKLFGAADLAMITTCFLWGLGAVVVKNAIGNTPDTFRVFVFNGIRMPVVSLLLFGSVWLSGGTIGLDRVHIPFIALVSFFGMFLSIVFGLTGLSLSSASNMGIIYATVPFFILIISFITGIERPSKSLVLGICIGMSGVLALSVQEGKISFNPGDILIVVSCLFWALYTVYSKRILNIYSPLVATAWVFLFASFYQLPLMLFQLRDQTWSTITSETWINLGIATIGSYFIANALYFFAIHKIGPIRVGLHSNLEPVFTLILAYLLRGEHITVMKIIGFMVILIGIAITKVPARAKPV